MSAKPSIVLGITYGHGDSAAAVIVDGCLLAAAEEERFTRIKHYALFPLQAIAYCLYHAKISASDVQVVAIARQPGAHFGKKLSLLWQYPQLYKGRKSHNSDPSQKQRLRKMLKQAGLKSAKIVYTEHHLAHLLSARFLAPSNDVALLSFDGMGDFTSVATGRPTDFGVEILDRIHYPHSLGFFYEAMTRYLGFPHFGDEFKVMGLSSYGKPRYLTALRELIREDAGFGFHLNLEAFPLLKQPMGFHIKDGQPVTEPFYNRPLLTQIIGLPQRKSKDPLEQEHRDLAKSVQARFEEVANHLLKKLHEKLPAPTVALAGGCAHNSVWVGKIPGSTPFTDVVVAPASNDAGLAVGAAIGASQVRVIPEGQHWALLGMDHSESTKHAPDSPPAEFHEQSFSDDESLIDWMVGELTKKKIIGLYRGRMEFGPRALGNRSILADPRWAEMKDKLNHRVKHRETFRPFAASVLWEHQEAWFNDSFFCPSMEAVFIVNESCQQRIPGVVHVDKTCRIQSVVRDTQPFYWQLIEAFRKKTGVPMLINTSFNDCEPIVCTEKDAWECFNNTELDHLVIGSRVFSRVRAPVALTA